MTNHLLWIAHNPKNDPTKLSVKVKQDKTRNAGPPGYAIPSNFEDTSIAMPLCIAAEYGHLHQLKVTAIKQ